MEAKIYSSLLLVSALNVGGSVWKRFVVPRVAAASFERRDFFALNEALAFQFELTMNGLLKWNETVCTCLPIEGFETSIVKVCVIETRRISFDRSLF